MNKTILEKSGEVDNDGDTWLKIPKEGDDDIEMIDETLRIANEMGRTGKCIFCDFTCEPNPGVASWYNEPLLDHRDEAHPETVEWFY